MRHGTLGCALITAIICGSAFGDDFQGWQGMRVIRQDGRPTHLRCADIDGDGRDEIIVINTRQSRLDIYQWMPKAQRKKAETKKEDERPNELPMAPEFEKEELALNELPRDVLVTDVNGDGTNELVILASPPNKVVVYKRDAKSKKWNQSNSWDLLRGTISARSRAMLVRPGKTENVELMISFATGIQTLELKKNARAKWHSPRERRARVDWWLFDLDGDGDQDLVEWSRTANESVRWYESNDQGLLPGQVLYKQTVDGVTGIAANGKGSELLLLGGLQKGLLRRFVMSQGEANPLGSRQALPLGGEQKAVWTGVQLGDKKALAAVDPAQPRMLVHVLGPKGWLAAQTFPIISKVQGLAAPQAKPGSILLWAKDAGDLQISEWKNGRLSYPKPMPTSADVEDRKILALQTIGGTTWWVQKVGKDLDLYVWGSKDKEPAKTRFTAAGEKTEKVVWIGGKKILFLEKYARSPKLASNDKDGKTTVGEPAQIKKTVLEEFRLFDIAGELRRGRMTDGVLQWLDDDLHPIDQIMLPEGAKLSSYLPLAADDAWALEAGGAQIHRLKADKSGIMRVNDSIKLNGGNAVVNDSVLGMMLIGQRFVAQMTPGKPFELKVVQTIDSREGRPSGVKQATIHRIITTDVTGDGADDVLLCDDLRHQLSLLMPQDNGDLKALMSWPVFEDKAYPYGGPGGTPRGAEPRNVVGLDLDGDKRQDLAMLCHDRILIYIAREEK